jgi:hypothetical protein
MDATTSVLTSDDFLLTSWRGFIRGSIRYSANRRIASTGPSERAATRRTRWLPARRAPTKHQAAGRLNDAVWHALAIERFCDAVVILEELDVPRPAQSERS